MSTIAELEPGTTFGEFRIVRRLATGGMGAVYVAEQIATGRQRALKLMHPGLVSSRELREKFTLEARVGARIASEHVVEVVAAGVEAASGAPWLAMELLTGEDLSHALKRRGAFTVNETAAILAQVCHALGAAHTAGIVHRDLKPENVFLAESRRASESYTVKVLDFGIAKVLEAARGSNTGAIGSPLWMAPEQTERNAEISPSTDVWALGLVTFTLLTGKSFWLAADQQEMALSAFLRELVLDEIPKASDRAAALGVPDTIPRGFDEWFARALAREREARFANATDAYVAFCEALGLETVHSGTGPVRVPTGGMRAEARALTPASASADANGQVRISSGGGLPESKTETGKLATARTLADVGPPGDGDDDDDKHAAPSAVPVQGPSPKWLALGGIALALVVTVSAVALLRGGKATGDAPERADAAAALPFCPKGMVRVPAGELLMGTSAGPSEEQPPHTVKVGAFCIDLTEVTVHDFKDCADRKLCSANHAQVDFSGTKEERDAWAVFCNEGKNGRADHPMNCVTFEDAAAYCKSAGKRLPTEEQWEYAARGTDGRAYPWGHEPPVTSRVNGCDEGCAKLARKPSDTIAKRLDGDDHWESTSPTGAFPEGVGPFGTFDMAGNVAEWVDAPFCNYGQSACGTGARVVRGGSWTSDLATSLRTTARAKASPGARQADVGFRCAK